MKKRKSILTAALLLSMLLSLLSGCIFDALEGLTPFPNPEENTRPQPTFPRPIRVPEPSETTKVTEPPEVTEATLPPETAPTTAAIPTISSKTDLRDYMNAVVDSGTLGFSFYYTGSEPPTAQEIAQILSCCYISYDCSGDLYHVTVTEYPGDRIVDAWQNADRSELTATESRALDYAVDLVENWTAYTSDPWELELLIHDYLSEHILYTEGDVNFTDPNNVPRELTAIGALLDGRANCQGYVDAFYLLATLAGLQVDRMYVEDPSGYHVVNTILLDGQWYVVDVTFDDMDDESVLSHYLFNVGTDRIREYSWAPEMEYRPLARRTGESFYYAHQDTLFYDAQSAARYVAENWDGGEACFRFMLQGYTEDQPMNDALYDALTETGLAFYYTYWYYCDGTDIYFTLFLE